MTLLFKCTFILAVFDLDLKQSIKDTKVSVVFQIGNTRGFVLLKVFAAKAKMSQTCMYICMYLRYLDTLAQFNLTLVQMGIFMNNN